MAKLISELCELVHPLSVEDYTKQGGFSALEKTFKIPPEDVIKEISDSKLVGRGGAAFPSGIKMNVVAKEQNEIKYVICNADEGEPGTFKDKYLLNHVPFQIIEGMIIAGYAVGAHYGYIYIRGEYPDTHALLKRAIQELKKNQYLGNNIMDSGFNFNIELRAGTGAYVCGEETALIESIEGKGGDPRLKFPYTAVRGLWDKPTLVNNVETLANFCVVMNIGAEKYKMLGTDNSKGTKLFSVSGCVNKKGVYELEFGTSLRELIDTYCGGIEDDKAIKFVQVGGSSGGVFPAHMLDIALDYESFRKYGVGLGSGAVFVADESICIVDFLKATMKFFQHESCGKCTPCREGNRHIVKILDRISEGKGKMNDIKILLSICNAMIETALCGLGQSAPTALLTCIEYFRDEIEEHIHGYCRTGVCKFGKEGY